MDKLFNKEGSTNTVLLLNKAIRQIADASGAGACCGVDVGGDVSHTAKTIIARYDKLSEQNKLLRDCLSDLDHTLYGYKNPPPLVKTAIDNAQKALEATK